MNIDFMHNQIIRDTISDKFIESFNENLMPCLISEYGSSLECVQFYEDHLADGLRIEGEFFYPLTVVVSGKPFIRAIKWQVSNYRNYDKFNPFTYKGKELLEFELLDVVPECVLRAVEDRAIYFDEEEAMPIFVSSPSEDKTFLRGKYSQTFVDLLCKSVTELIESEFSISGLARSGVILELRFEAATFMEHIVESTTYRRILIKARGCGARDLFIKWERLDGCGTYSISDNVSEGDILFSLAEDTPGRIREREYRYLTAEGRDLYQAKMSRKNITEWREMMRRVIKRGEVMVVDSPSPEDEELEELLDTPISDNTEPEVILSENEPIVSELDSLIALLDSEPIEDSEEDNELDDDLTALLQSAIGLTTSGAVIEEIIPDEEEDIPPFDMEDEPSSEMVEEIPTFTEEAVEEEAEEEMPREPITPAPVIVEQISVPPMPDEEKIRLEIEARVRAEMEERLREKEREAEELRLRLEAQIRAEERERERVAELARARLAENERLERERREQQRLEQERLLREERERAEQEARERAEREERERLEREAAEARERAENERLERERAERERLEREAAEREPEPIKYVAKTVKLFFRRAVNPDIANKIHEIILATIKYYHKENVYIKIKANFPDPTTLNLDFVKIPENEIGLLVNIIKVLGRSDLGITKASLD